MRRSVGFLFVSTLLAQEPLRLSLREAVELAVSAQGNLGARMAAEAVSVAAARQTQARSALLPHVEGAIGAQNLTRNLEAFGIRFETPIPGFQAPTFVGPFNVFDARVYATQTVLDMATVRRWQASRTATAAARAEHEAALDGIAWQTARFYLGALKADADIEAARANVELAGALVELAESQKRAGTGTGIETTRARVQLANERQRLLVAQNQARAARFQLLRALGAPQDTRLELTETLRFEPTDTQAQAVERSDLRAQREREAAARLAAGAAAMERLPTVVAAGDYGAIGTSPGSGRATRIAGVSLRVPIFDGGARGARRAEAEAQLRIEQARRRDLEEQIALEVRLAADALASAAEQVNVAEEGLALAANELAQARRRYEAGVTTSLEVTDAQARLARARDNRVSALYQHNQARIDYGQAVGAIRRMLP
jgi:outer membrane protein TolC